MSETHFTPWPERLDDENLEGLIAIEREPGGVLYEGSFEPLQPTDEIEVDLREDE
jgi:hypothetical protein